MQDPFAPQFEFAFEVRLRFRPLPKVKDMPTGGDRGMVVLEGGEFEGPELSGIALPGSGGDFCLFRPDGVLAGAPQPFAAAAFSQAGAFTALPPAPQTSWDPNPT